MYFNEKVFNPQYMNPYYYQKVQATIVPYDSGQDLEVAKAVKAVHDLCEAVKKMDDQHQRQAFYACLGEMAKVFNWT